MNIIVGSRGRGKSKELVAISHKENIPILCLNSTRVNYILEHARKMKLDIPRPWTVGDIRDGTYHTQVIVDDVPDVLSHLLGIQVHSLSLNAEVGELKDLNLNQRLFSIVGYNRDSESRVIKKGLAKENAMDVLETYIGVGTPIRINGKIAVRLLVEPESY